MRRSGSDVVRSIGASRDLCGLRRLSIVGRGQGEAGHCCRGDGRDGDVACDNGVWHGGDASLREDRVVAGSPELDICWFGVGQLALLNTSDGLGICRQQVGEEENDAARFGKEHRYLENLRNTVCKN